MGRFNWGIDGPPDDAYSRVTEPERFAVLHDVAAEIVEDLRSRFDARVVDLSEPPSLLGIRDQTRVARTARVEPPNVGAPITVVWTAFPAVSLAYGWWQEETVPPCACDACDEDGESASDQLRRRITSIVDRGFTEALVRRSQRNREAAWDRGLPAEFRRAHRRMLRQPKNPVAWAARQVMERKPVWWLEKAGSGETGSSRVEGSRFDELASLHVPGTVVWPPWA
jgi:hypothetical protein